MQTLLFGLILLSIGASPPDQASMSGYVAEIKTEFTGPPVDRVNTGVITSAGTSARVDYRNGDEVLSSVIRTAEGRHNVLNHRNKTFYSPKLPAGAGATMRLAQPPWPLTSAATAKVRSISLTEDIDSQVVDGQSASLNRLVLSFDVKDRMDSETLKASVDVRLEFWTTDAFDPTIYAIEPREVVTGFSHIDAKVKQVMSRPDGTVIKSRIEITRSVRGGTASTGVITTSLTNVRAANVPAGTFDVPAGYRYQEPTYALPNIRKEGDH